MEILWERIVSTQFYGNSMFPQNFQTRKLVETSVLIAVIVGVMSEIQSLL